MRVQRSDTPPQVIDLSEHVFRTRLGADLRRVTRLRNQLRLGATRHELGTGVGAVFVRFEGLREASEPIEKLIVASQLPETQISAALDVAVLNVIGRGPALRIMLRDELRWRAGTISQREFDRRMRARRRTIAREARVPPTSIRDRRR